MTVGIVTGFSATHAAGLEEFLLNLLDGLSQAKPANVSYRIYTRAGNGLAEVLSKRGLTCFSVVSVPFGPLWRSIGLLFMPRSDVYLWNGPLFSPWLDARKSAVLVYDFAYKHFGKPSMQTRLLDIFSRLSFHGVKKVITISRATQDELIRQYAVSKKKIEVIYPGVKNFQVNKEELIGTPPQGYFLFVGTTKERKNVLNLIKGFSVAAGKIPQDLLVAGRCDFSSPYGKKIVAFISQNGLKNRVHFLGSVSDGTLRYLYRNAVAFTFPSAFEGFGMPVVEAMSEGVPVLTSNVSSLPEAAGDAGLLVDPFDPIAISEALVELSKNPLLRQTMVAKGLEHAKKFSWEASAKRFIEVLSAL